MAFEFIHQELIEQKQNDLYRQLHCIEENNERNLIVDGKRYINFSSNDYYWKCDKLLESLENIERNSSSQDHFKRALNHWFDGFQQLKYLHFLRDQGAANVTLSTVLSAPWLDSNVIKTRRREALLALL